MKVLFITNVPAPYRVAFFNQLGKQCELTVAFEGHESTERNKKWKANMAESFSPVYLKGIRTAADKFLCPGIVKLLRQKWDAIILAGYSTPTLILAIKYLYGHKIPFGIEADGGFVPAEESKVKYLLKKALISSADYWFSSSRFTTDYLVHYGAKKEKCFLFPFSSLSNDDINCAKTDWSHIKSNKKPTVLFVGQIVYRKGYDLLLEVAKRLDDVEFVFAGGECESSLDNVHFVGFKTKKELAEYYSNADIFVLPTREDIWGLVINEAMSFGLPVITTDRCIAGLELVDEGENGFIVKADSIDALHKKIVLLANDEELRLKMGAKSLEAVKEYTIENMVDAHIKTLSHVSQYANPNEERYRL